MSGIPCDHVCVAIRRMGLDVSDYVDDWYKYNFQEKIYSRCMRTLVTHDMPMIDEDGTVHDALVILIPFLILQPQSNLLEDLGNIESSLNSCKKKKKQFIVLVVMSLGIIV